MHLEKFVADDGDALVFGTSTGNYLARSNWNLTFRRAADSIGLPAVRPHELRHTGATLAVTRRVASDATTGVIRRIA